ncbi:alpha/beta fold hydrolase [Haloarchaeobius sp. FL176]|uniref:alpha/beta fold hydrolase n=1 Tax=Haloarchaeobius sp. FL176 TaxID=2967129 RepID=UPI0021488312|nr:alpha/beta fold hydrolase [Haloarchaeobius sp. FL176]
MTGHGIARVDGLRIHYRRAGTDGPNVVLLHGAGIDDADLSWRHTVETLAEDYQVYAPDWPDYGDSDPVDDHSIDTYREVFAGFVDSVGLDEFALVGISMGGAVALGYTLDHPDRVRALGLVDSYGLGARVPGGPMLYALANVPGANATGWSMLGSSRAATVTGLANVVHDPSMLDEAFVDAVNERASQRGAGRAFTDFQRNEITPDGRARTNYADRLGEVAVPTLLVHGESDPLFPVAWARRAHEGIPDSELVVFEDCGHWPTREHPDRFDATLLRFLRERMPPAVEQDD